MLRMTGDVTRLDLLLRFDGLDRYQRVRLRGSFDAARQILLDNMPSVSGRPGYRVLTPLDRADGRGWVLVDRGWVPLGATREALPDVAVDTREREVSGILDVLPIPGLRVGPAAVRDDASWPRVLLFPTEAGLLSSSSGGRYETRLHSVSPYIEYSEAEGKNSLSLFMWLTGRAAAVLVT